jgi:hypothetical protein
MAKGACRNTSAIWNAQHIRRDVSIYKSRTTLDHGLEAQFFNTLLHLYRK